ncbi:endonuclease I family protein [Sporosarcina pasteurii]|uniref:Extracellular ribonuclease n=1 Tax=Sporosarcina pasteurii TaxID=1474 RepID=A0A380CC44_SPOPA|nr:endonuclease [Sporosarcina pasteurii]MDS9473152.1 endonuclease [Sporosarcina pasteurii]QBQ04204.1 endonuclease I [Sporosarcina pasteurii]SUJ17480.1 Extracellular ribonuclease precursor [Sporosarcina pasteurii]
MSQTKFIHNLDLNAALAELKRNKKKVENEAYYDEESDQKAIQDYYDQIDFYAVDKKELFEILNQLISRTHKNQLPYNSKTRTYLYSRVDLQTNGKLKSIYSGKDQEPEQVIKEDYETERIRIEAYGKLLKSASKTDSEIQKAMATIESKNIYNTEHVVPQSWFDKDNPMRGDLHHLFTCEKACNSLRSNHPYFDFLDYPPEVTTETIKMHCGKYEDNKFEPENGKGEVARATLYFLLRYPGEISRYSHEDIEMLIDWHREYMVSIYEKRRNKEIFKIQKNRNPLIDFPEHIDKIDFTLGILL